MTRAADLISSDAVARWLGGWQLAREAEGLSDRPAPPLPPPPAPDGAALGGLRWTTAAVAECDRFRRLLAALDPDGVAVRRLGSLLVAAMVRAIVEDAASGEGGADLPLLPGLVLRIGMADGEAVVLGLHGSARIV